MEEKDENVVEETTQKTTEQTEETPQIDESKFESAGDDSVIKIDLSKPPKTESDVQSEVENTDVEDKSQEKVIEETPVEETTTQQTTEEITEKPTVEEITDEEEVEVEVEATQEDVDEAIAESEKTGAPLPENIQKLMDFMEETGGNLEDYVRLNQDYSNLDDQSLLYEYYKQTKPHLNNEEINFLMNDEFEYDEENDEEKTIKRKKLAYKEQVANARAHLDGQKSKYYKEIKAGSKLTPDQQKAIDFFNRHNEESEQTSKVVEQQKADFKQKTNEVFNDKFKGFEYNVGEKRFRLNVSDAGKIKDNQSDINNFVSKFTNKDTHTFLCDHYNVLAPVQSDYQYLHEFLY